MQHRSALNEKLKEALTSVLPLALIILLLSFTVSPMKAGVFLGFLVGCGLLIVGMGLFSLGAEVAMTPMGDYMGAHMAKSRRMWVVTFMSFLVGLLITISEPDLKVLARYVPSVEDVLMTVVVGAGVGVFLVIAMLRAIFGIRLRYLLLGFYVAVFALSAFVPPDFWAVAFDAGGVTTGPMTVPFIMTLGVGVSSIRSDKDGKGDTFGYVALCSVGPIVAVLTLGLIYGTQGGEAELPVALDYVDSQEMALSYLRSFPEHIWEVLVALLPITLLFLLYQAVSGGVGRKSLARIGIGLLYTLVGLALFLLGANVGFMPAGYLMGQTLGGSDIRWILPVAGAVIGYFLVAAEPAIQVLVKQVETVTAGAIPRRALTVPLSCGVAVSVGLALLRAMTGVSIMWFLAVGYGLAFVLSFLSDETFTAIAFDSGGVASGPMTATFLLALALGVTDAVGGNPMTDAFGMVALVAMTPLITIQILGVVYRHKLKQAKRTPMAELPLREEVIEL